jgi:hypothetical protein
LPAAPMRRYADAIADHLLPGHAGR